MSFALRIALIWPLSVGDWARAVCRPPKIKHRSEERRFLLSGLPDSQAESSISFRRLGMVGSFSGWQTKSVWRKFEMRTLQVAFGQIA
jgi:hypothetical protein